MHRHRHRHHTSTLSPSLSLSLLLSLSLSLSLLFIIFIVFIVIDDVSNIVTIICHHIIIVISLIIVTGCMALPRVKFLSNPRRMHSREEGEEKEEQGLPRAPSCCSTTFPAPSPPPPLHTCRAPTGLPGTRYQDTSPPLPHCKQANF
jgi:hypothetical protein